MKKIEDVIIEMGGKVFDETGQWLGIYWDWEEVKDSEDTK